MPGYFSVSFSPEVRQELRDPEHYLAGRFGSRSASRYVRRVIAACKNLGTVPMVGTSRAELHPGLRQTGFEKRITIYLVPSPKTRQLVIASVLYGGREADEDALSKLEL